MSAWKNVALGDVATIERSSVQPQKIQAGTIYVGLEHIETGGAFLGPHPVDAGVLASSKFEFTERHVLYGKLRPYLAKIACPDFSGICSTDILPILAGPKIERRFLYHFLRQPAMVEYANSQAVGINLPRLSPSVLAKIAIPLPPLPEQRQIADALDRAEALRAKRRTALAQLDTLTQSIFLDLFGDPATNPRGWSSIRLEAVLTIPLRNGVSPSHTGKIVGKVLTLSAITGSGFDETAQKVSTFQAALPPNQCVDENDFLICRGNGNVRLVGKGYFPSRKMSDVAFPDTMIAARVSRAHVDRAFLQHVWNSPAVRKQVESLARTTNGTFKVNQTMLEGITFVAPPLPRQQEFARRVAAVEKLKTSYRTSLAELDALFASLQHRAFRGEL